MKRLLLVLAAASILAAADKPRLTRQEIAAVEKNVDSAVRGLDLSDPYDLLGFTRGVYLPGYGVVFSAEVDLVFTPISPFFKPPTGVRLERLREKKLQRLTAMRACMRDALVNAAASLDQLPPSEQVVLGVTFFYRSFEQRTGLPNQIVMQAPRQALLDFKASRISRKQLEAAIQVEEL